MTFREIFRFEIGYQARHVRTWLYFAVLFVASGLLTLDTLESVRDGDAVLVHSPYVIAAHTVLCNVVWLLMAGAVAGSAAARDVQTRMFPLVYTAPLSKAHYLGARFLAAFILNASILLAVPLGMIFAAYASGAEAGALGPFRFVSYLGAYGVLAVPTAFVATAIQFSFAALSGRTVTAHASSVFIFVTSFLTGFVNLTMPALGRLLDPVGFITVLGVISKSWTDVEKSTRVLGLESPMIANRLLWIGVGLGFLAFTYLRFRFGHREGPSGGRVLTDDAPNAARSELISVHHFERTFGWRTHAAQTLSLAWTSVGTIAKSTSCRVLLAMGLLVTLFAPGLMDTVSIPVMPRTAQVVSFLTAPVAGTPDTFWVIVPLFIIFYAGELVFRERDARISDMTDATPAPEWVFFLGKFIGLSFVLIGWMAVLTAAGILAQARLGHFDFEMGLYLKTLFGLQLIDYLLFALLVVTVHAVVNHKQIGTLVGLVAYGFMLFASRIGIDQDLLVYAAAPRWAYTDMRGFGGTLGPWLWVKSYWVAWAVLLVLAAILIWPRGVTGGLRARLRQAPLRLTAATAGVAAVAAVSVLSLAGLILYETSVVNGAYATSAQIERSAEYEKRYKRYQTTPQPQLTRTSLRVEIHPERRAVAIDGAYTLENRGLVAIADVHLALSGEVLTGAMTFDRAAALATADDDHGYRIYKLQKPLEPGDSLRLHFMVRYEPRGFRGRGPDAPVVMNGTYITPDLWMPVVGYQRNRELRDTGARIRQGLPPRALPDPADAEARQGDRSLTAFEATLGTDLDQIAVGPGALRRTWTEGPRRYFDYAADAPIPNDYSFFSARYALHETSWRSAAGTGPGVAIRIYHDPRHSANLEGMVRGIGAALDFYTEQFGPYVYSHLTVVERGTGDALSAQASMIDYGQGYTLFNPGPRNADMVFFGMAHEVAHQWWGHRLMPARALGEVLLAEGLANYSAMQVLEESYGREHLNLYLRDVLHAAYQRPRTRAARPLLRADNAFLGYRKGAHALYALSRYIGAERVNGALRRLFDQNSSGTPPLPTTLDLYRELQAVTPAEYRTLLHDLFEANAYWEVKTDKATAKQTEGGAWEVTLEVRARKATVDEAGAETEIPMDDWVEVGVFGENDEADPIYSQKHRITSGAQKIKVTVPTQPERAGLDPHYLLTERGELDTRAHVKLAR